MQEVAPGFFQAKMGDTIARTPLERYKGLQAKKDLMAILLPDPSIVKIKYIPNVGQVYSTDSRWFIENFGLADVRYIFPVFMYPSDMNGKLVEGSNDFQLKFLQIGTDQYEILKVEFGMTGDLRLNDYVVTCADQKYQKLDFRRGTSTLWRNNEVMKQFAKEKMATYKENIIVSVAQPLSDEQIQKRLKDAVERDAPPPYATQTQLPPPSSPPSQLDGEFDTSIPSSQPTPPMQTDPIPPAQQIPIEVTAEPAPTRVDDVSEEDLDGLFE